MSTRSRNYWSNILVPLAVALAVVLPICGALYWRDANRTEKMTLDNEVRRMDRFTGLFDHDISSAVTDLRLLATGDGLQSYLATGLPADLDRAVHRALFFGHENPDYDQIRYLDEHGQEIFRVNVHGEIVPRDQLQNKADRPYFQKAIGLAPGEIYLSAIDLNVERGAIEQPLKPTVRLAMPVVDASGRKRGIYVINYLVGNSIERLLAYTPQYQQRLRLLNAQGYWLKGGRPGEEWGFMLPGRSEMTLARTNPDLWERVVNKPAGQEPYGGGYFTWQRAIPKEFARGKSVTLVTDDDFLVFASFISPEEWASSLAQLRQTFVVMAALLLILATVIGGFFHARRRVQRELDHFFTLTNDLICIAGFDGYFKRVNPAWEKTFGYASEEFLTKPFEVFLHPDDVEPTQREFARQLHGEAAISFENRYRCKDGSYRWLQWNAQPRIDEEVIFASARDVTERKKAEEALRSSEARSRSIIESAHDAFVSIDIEGRIKDWNIQAETMFGWTRAEALGRYLHETIIPQNYRADHLRGIKHLRATGEGPVLNKTIELTALRRNGDEFPVELVIWPLRMGEETSYHAFVRDITARKEATERIERLNEELKQRAHLLEVANKELQSFSYSVSHDLRAPLRHIHGFVELLQKSPSVQKDESNRRYMGIISRAAKVMGQLIDDLLAFAKTNRAEMHPVNIDMRAMVGQVIRDLEKECGERKVTWEVKPLSGVAADSHLMRLVWSNLLDNALKYTQPHPEAKIEIGQVPCNHNGAAAGEAVFYVRDDGVGFDMEYASKLFGVFQRLHRAEDFEGTGIGLATVQRIIHRHGGRVWAEGRVDVGATFYFSLPVTATQPS